MLASSAFVLAALTMTGVYMQSRNSESKDDGYTIDFSAMENNTSSKAEEIARQQAGVQEQEAADSRTQISAKPNSGAVLEDDLDYMPMEAGSNLVEIPGLTDHVQEKDKEPETSTQPDATTQPEEQKPAKQTAAEKSVVAKELHFAEADGLLRPVQGEVLLPFSMDGSIYFSTLDQYKYNPALMLQAEEGTSVTACAEGRVTDIFEDAEIGHAVTMELGDGYQITYGQLKEINVTPGSYVNAGEQIGQVAAPTKYFSVEGANLYLKLTADDVPVNPEALFR